MARPVLGRSPFKSRAPLGETQRGFVGVMDLFRIIAIVGTSVSLAHLGLMSLNQAAGAIVALVALLGVWRGISPQQSSGDCGGCVLSAALPILGILGLVLSNSIGDTNMLKAIVAEFIGLFIVVLFAVYLPCRAVGSAFRSK